MTQSLNETTSVHHQNCSDVGEFVLCKPVCTHLITQDPQELCECVWPTHHNVWGVCITCMAPNLPGVFVNSIPTPAVQGQHIPLYFPNKVSLLSHILCAMAHELVDPGCIEVCKHSNSSHTVSQVVLIYTDI